MIDPTEHSDVDALDELLASPGWSLVKARLEALLETSRRDLERDIVESSTNKARGAVAALRIAIGLPENMREEFAAQIKG